MKKDTNFLSISCNTNYERRNKTSIIELKMKFSFKNKMLKRIKLGIKVKILTWFLILMLTPINAKADSPSITISMKNAPLEKVFEEIENQTNYGFLYIHETLENTRNVSLDVTNASVEKVLQLCFKDQPLTYKILDRVIVVIKVKLKIKVIAKCVRK